MNIFKNIFGSNKKWREDHVEYWADELKLDEKGFSKFLSELASRVKYELNELKIDFSTETTSYTSISDINLELKTITFTLGNLTDSKVWIHYDMAEYNLKTTHHFFEEWGYLKPDNLRDIVIDSLKNEIKKLRTT